MHELFNNEWETIYTVRNPTELARIVRETQWTSDTVGKIVEAGRRYNYAAIDVIMGMPEVEPMARGWSTYVIARLEGRDRARAYIFEKYPHWRETVECNVLARSGDFPELERYMASINLMRR